MDKVDTNKIFCEVCSVPLQNKALLHQHNSEKKHLDLVRAKEKRMQLERKHGKASKAGAESNIDGFLYHIRNIPELENQVTNLIYFLQGDTLGFKIYDSICQDLSRTLMYSFPTCRIFPFGSTVTGLCFRSSDLDMYVAGIRYRKEKSVSVLYKIKSILINSQLFNKTIVIAHAKIPILKCVHVASGINCDINIRNMLGVCNSEMIKYYLNLDVKIRRIIFIIKYWAKTHRITGQNHLFTNYSLSLMLLFFLQVSRFKVPSVFSLQDINCRYIEDGWNGGFSRKNFFSRDLRNVSLSTLLSEFFVFYSDFEYGLNVISPYLGVALKKTDFEDSNLLHENVFSLYKKYIRIEGNIPLKVRTPICVQDPFEHSRNTTPSVSDSTLNIFVNLCRLGKNICDEGENRLIFRLVTEAPPSPKMNLSANLNSIQFSLPMNVNTRYLEGKIGKEISDTKTALKQAWFESVNEFLLIVLRDFFKIDVEDTTDESTKRKIKKVEGHTDVHDEKEMIRSYTCVAKFNLWQNRKSTLKNINNESLSGIIDKEVEVTKRLMDLNKNFTSAGKIMEFEVSLASEYNPAQIFISVRRITSYKKTFKGFSQFFAMHFRNWFETYEKEMNT